MQRLSVLIFAALLVAVHGATVSSSGTVSPSWTVSVTGTVSWSGSVSWSVTNSVSGSVSITVSNSPSASGSPTPTPSPAATPSGSVSGSSARAGICGDGSVNSNANDFLNEECDHGTSLNAVYNSAGACCSTGCKFRDGNVRCAPRSDNQCLTVPRCDGRGNCRTSVAAPENSDCTLTGGVAGVCRNATCVKKSSISKSTTKKSTTKKSTTKKRTTGRRRRTTGRR